MYETCLNLSQNLTEGKLYKKVRKQLINRFFKQKVRF